ncbi:hypothetical protein [Coleofasciculus sp. E1-EBD-02]|uniref:hypothetical protein n=1 Tax=Coleofasciculus sp. E1-EBD-02 TaxID=3068481 RepID=UPI0040641A85
MYPIWVGAHRRAPSQVAVLNDRFKGVCHTPLQLCYFVTWEGLRRDRAKRTPQADRTPCLSCTLSLLLPSLEMSDELNTASIEVD